MSTKIDINDIPKNPVVRRAWVLFQLRIRGESFASVARNTGVSRQSIVNCCYMPSRWAEQAIADTLGIRVEDLFPERFDGAGQRITQTRPAQRSKIAGRHNVKARGAA